MIVARGLGLGSYGGPIPTAGLGKIAAFIIGGGGSFQSNERPRSLPTATKAQDARDLAEILPAIIGVLFNGNS